MSNDTEQPGDSWTTAPPPEAPSVQPAAAPPRRSRLGLRVAAGALVFAAGMGGGVAIGRASNPVAGTATSVTSPSTASPSGGASAGTSGSSSPQDGVVDVNVNLGGGSRAAGTGVVITSGGEVLTNNHVIDGAQSINVQVTSTGATYSAHVLGYDVSDDVALLQIDGGSSFTTAHLGNSDSVSVGEAVTAVGNALGQGGAPAMTTGTVTALDQTITAGESGSQAETLNGLIETDAQIQPGDSGGPLVDPSGKVIGIDTAAQTSSRRFAQQGSTAGYAIPINAAMSVVHQIQSGSGTSNVHIGATRAFLGVGTQDTVSGVEVGTVQSGSPAANAGIVAGDVITSIGGTTVDTSAALRTAILDHNPGDKVQISWTDQSGQSHTATVTLASSGPA